MPLPDIHKRRAVQSVGWFCYPGDPALQTLLPNPYSRQQAAWSVGQCCKGGTPGGLPHDTPLMALTVLVSHDPVVRPMRKHPRLPLKSVSCPECRTLTNTPNPPRPLPLVHCSYSSHSSVDTSDHGDMQSPVDRLGPTCGGATRKAKAEEKQKTSKSEGEDQRDIRRLGRRRVPRPRSSDRLLSCLAK